MIRLMIADDHMIMREGLKRLFELAQQDIMLMVQQAMRLGLHAPKFPPKVA